MKKIVLGLAMAAIATGSLSAVARPAQKSGNNCNSKSEYVVNREFAGLNLTPEQEGRLEALNNGYKVSRQELRDSLKNLRAEGNTVSARQEVRQLRARYLQDVKEILSSDQYVTFLTNYYINDAAKPSIAMKARKEGMKIKDEAGKVSRDIKKDAAKVGKEMKREAKKVAKAVK